MSVKFSVKMNEKYMYDFFVYDTYSKISGKLMPIVGLLCLGMAIYTWIKSGFTAALPMTIFAVWFLVLDPIQTKARAKMQVKNTPTFQKPLEYEIDENGITVRQEEAEALNKWEDIAKVAVTKRCILVYMNRVRAIILPKECMGDNCEAVIQIIRENVPAKKIRMK